ncbi:hypothetical protein AB0D13_40600 [Streptomyces sp. NPDC048430]|uniref:hypothetical protein n=1 Tax=Streptomyces sp. NPDC048430 TaxID=3155388 RepID=UPI00342E3313
MLNTKRPAPQASTEVAVSTVRTPGLTRAHHVLPVGQQHIDDAAPMGQCTACEEVGEWNALVDLAPSAYGCSGRPPYDFS